MYTVLSIFLGGVLIGILVGYLMFHRSDYEDFYAKKNWREKKKDD